MSRTRFWHRLRQGIGDAICRILLWPAALVLRRCRTAQLHRLPGFRDVLLRVGVFPIANHYYEPRFDYTADWATGPRQLPGIDLDVGRQSDFLDTITCTDDLSWMRNDRRTPGEFHFGNSAFEPGDAEVWYHVIRHFKPSRIIEIGSGFSTLVARRAIASNIASQSSYTCDHICIEPYEHEWLGKTGAHIIRQRVEVVGNDVFSTLQENDILFIDSSHIIRPGGDVLHEFLEILPRIKPGVLVHIHDIFTPSHYPDSWLKDRVLFWNEQYLVEAMLSGNQSWEILLALNFLRNQSFASLQRAAPHLEERHQPASLYIRRSRSGFSS